VSSDSTWGPDMYYVNYAANDEGNFTGNATELDSTDLTNPANYPTLDFVNVWKMGDKYPVLKGFNFTSSIQKGNKHFPYKFALEQNYPNPFNPKTVISFSIPRAENIKLEVFNLVGQRVRVLVDDHLNAGTYALHFIAKDLPSGIYYYRLTAGEFQQVKKMVLVK